MSGAGCSSCNMSDRLSRKRGSFRGQGGPLWLDWHLICSPFNKPTFDWEMKMGTVEILREKSVLTRGIACTKVPKTVSFIFPGASGCHSVTFWLEDNMFGYSFLKWWTGDKNTVNSRGWEMVQQLRALEYSSGGAEFNFQQLPSGSQPSVAGSESLVLCTKIEHSYT